jgi:adenylate kinase
VYNEKTAPLIGYYDKKGMLLTIKEASSDGVVNAIKKGIAGKK